MKPESFSVEYAPLPLPRWLVVAMCAMIGCYIGAVFLNPPVRPEFIFWAVINLVALLIVTRLRNKVALTRSGQKLEIITKRAESKLTLADLEPVKQLGKHWRVAWRDERGPITLRIPDRALDKPARKILQRLSKATASNSAE